MKTVYEELKKLVIEKLTNNQDLQATLSVDFISWYGSKYGNTVYIEGDLIIEDHPLFTRVRTHRIGIPMENYRTSPTGFSFPKGKYEQLLAEIDKINKIGGRCEGEDFLNGKDMKIYWRPPANAKLYCLNSANSFHTYFLIIHNKTVRFLHKLHDDFNCVHGLEVLGDDRDSQDFEMALREVLKVDPQINAWQINSWRILQNNRA